MQQLAEQLIDCARDSGLDRIGFCAAVPLPSASVPPPAHRCGLEPAGLEEGDLRRLLPGARSVVVAVIGHHYALSPPPPLPHGRIARMALGEDYHRLMHRRLAPLVQRLHQAGHQALAGVDAWAVPERRLAEAAGLGWLGRNQALFVPGLGSFVSIGAILTDAELPAATPMRSPCGNCRRCQEACPARALHGEASLDASRCISCLTQLKRPLSQEEATTLGPWIFGCDICQEVCPQNAGMPLLPSPPGFPAFPELEALFGLRPALLPPAWRESTALWRGLAVLRRNALVAAWNGTSPLGAVLRRRAASDPSPLLREQAALLAPAVLPPGSPASQPPRC